MLLIFAVCVTLTTLTNGDAVNATALTADLRSGDELRLQIAWKVKTGDTFTLIYKPTGDLLQRIRVA